MYKAPQSLQPPRAQVYEYRVELINQRNSADTVFRLYQSEFEVGECWGYNRFYKIDSLEANGFLSSDSDDCIILKYYVRPPTFHQLSKDM